MVNKYDKDMTEIRLSKVLGNYVRKDELDMAVYTLLDTSLQDSVNDISATIEKMDDKIDNNERNTKAILDKIFLCIKIIFALLFILIIFGVIFVVSYFNFESSVREKISDTGSINITYELEAL